MELLSTIAQFEQNTTLFEDQRFDERMEVIDFIAFEFAFQLAALLQTTNHPDQLILLQHRAEKLEEKLEQVNMDLFLKLRKGIQNKAYPAGKFGDLIHQYVEFNIKQSAYQHAPDYDNLDILINGLTTKQNLPEPAKELEPEMVFYQKTPARIVFELAERAHFTPNDVFFDLGSGLGQATILVNLLSGVKAFGVEFDPAFCHYAAACAASLNLADVTFINTDARTADFTQGTVFFMYTPFEGKIMNEVLNMLQKRSRSGKISIFTYGPCTAVVTKQSWLQCLCNAEQNHYKLGVFCSI